MIQLSTKYIVLSLIVSTFIVYMVLSLYNRVLTINQLHADSAGVKDTFARLPTTEDGLMFSEQLKSLLMIDRDVEDLWFYVKAELTSLKNKWRADVEDVMLNVRERTNIISNYITRLESASDKARAWQDRQHDLLSNRVQERIHQVQNPEDCGQSRKKVYCELNDECGFGCSMHYVVYCLLVAYATDRTLILNDDNWHYAHEGMLRMFKPLASHKCDRNVSATPRVFCSPAMAINSSHCRQSEIMQLDFLDHMDKPAFLPRGIPSMLDKLTFYHSDPVAWWLGQFISYIFRYNDVTEKHLSSYKLKINFTNDEPIAGIAIRGTDHEEEAASHEIDEYMDYVENFFEKQELAGEYRGRPTSRRKVYVSADNPYAIQEVKRRYGRRYEVLGDEDIAGSALVSERYSEASLLGLVGNIHLLSLCDYLVCKQSSQVCRVSYELMSSRKSSVRGRMQSLDDLHYFGGQTPRLHQVTYKHIPRLNQSGHLQVWRGDVVVMLGNHFDGYSKAVLNDLTALVPSYKTEQLFHLSDFRSFEH